LNAEAIMAQKDDPTWAARTMRELTPHQRELAIVYGILQGVVVDGRERFRPWSGHDDEDRVA
jgi:hypothetical protein